MNLDSAFLEIIPLGNVPTEATVVTPKILEIIEKNQQNHKKTLIFYNRRGSASAWICRDCGFFKKCENCDIALSYHTFPRRRLICHQCNIIDEPDFSCPSCRGQDFATVGVGIEEVARTIEKNTKLPVAIIDSDHISRTSEIFSLIEKSEIILSTSLGALLSDDRIGAVIFALFELNFSIPEYSLEEELFAQVSYIKKQQKPLYIQTFSPEHPMLQTLVFGNFRDYFERLKTERKKFSYPPFVDFVTIYIHHRDKKNVQNMISGLVEHIYTQNVSETFVAYDRDIWEKSHGEWLQKIILKWKNVSDILAYLAPFIVKNRYISVHWH